MMTPEERHGERRGARLDALPNASASIMTPHERYAEASAALRRAEERVRSLTEQLSALAQALDSAPLTLMPAHESARDALPLHVTTHPFRQEIDLTSWPDADAIIGALADLHAARSRALAMRAWMLPEDQSRAEEIPHGLT